MNNPEKNLTEILENCPPSSEEIAAINERLQPHAPTKFSRVEPRPDAVFYSCIETRMVHCQHYAAIHTQSEFGAMITQILWNRGFIDMIWQWLWLDRRYKKNRDRLKTAKEFYRLAWMQR